MGQNRPESVHRIWGKLIFGRSGGRMGRFGAVRAGRNLCQGLDLMTVRLAKGLGTLPAHAGWPAAKRQKTSLEPPTSAYSRLTHKRWGDLLSV